MDERIEKGMLAVSRAGHDCGELYVITELDERFVWLADGRLKTVENPKKKSRKHIQVIRRERMEIPCTAANEAVKRVLKLYRARSAQGNQED